MQARETERRRRLPRAADGAFARTRMETHGALHSVLGRLAAAAAFLALAACDPAAMGGMSNRVSVPVGGRSVAIVAPAGFCVDRASTNVSATGAFVLASDCALLAGRAPAAGATSVGAVLTASVSAGDGARSLSEIAAFSTTSRGRAALGRSGRSAGVRIRATQTRNDVLYLLIEDRGPQPIAGIEPQFWRAFLDLQGQLTVLSVLGFQGAGVGAIEGFAIIQAFADAAQSANRS
jgi:hypothetical protein